MYKVIIWDVLFFSPSPFRQSSESACALIVEDPQENTNGAFLMINYKMYGAVTDPFMTGLSQVVEKEGLRQWLPNDPPPPKKKEKKKKRKGTHLET